MTDYIVHRGPDSAGFYIAPRLALGMRRLSIIDRMGGHQPIASESGAVVVVFNGEIWNHLDLRADLESLGHRFATHSDTEVLVHGYEQWGIEGLLDRLNGMFAFALHDRSTGAVLLARDRVGVKPLYYTVQGGVLYFASEVKAFLAVPEVSLAPDEGALGEYLTLRYVPAPRTLFAGILKLPAGHWMSVAADGNHRVNRYWFPRPQDQRLDDDEYVERFGELFRDAVRIRMMSEVPIGAYLSEGLDSNMVVWAMAQATNRKVSTYSIGFGGRHDETEGAERSASILGSEHHSLHFDEADFNDLAKVVWHLDEPIGDAHVLPTYILAREAKRTLTVVLLGEGADESLYGYPFYKLSWLARAATRPAAGLAEMVLPRLLEMTPLPLLRAVNPMPAQFGAEARRHLAAFLRVAPRGHGEDLFRVVSGLFGPAELGQLMRRPPTPGRFPFSTFGIDPDDRSPDALLQQINDAQFGGWLQDNILLRHDKMAMAHSVEVREPFLDYRLIEFMAGVPRRLKVSGWKDKILSRRFAARHIHPDIARRPKKPFFLPMENFVASGAFRRLADENLNPARLARRGWFNAAVVADLAARAESRDFLAVKRVMSLIILELWARTFIDGELAERPPEMWQGGLTLTPPEG
jgi:asparagine synthase (glutamine-hydrolysing)